MHTAMPHGSGDRWADDYDRGRPSYPPQALDVAGLPATAEAVDLGAGTGKLTRLLVERFARVFAVEPAVAMRRVLERAAPRATVLDGSAEAIPLGDDSADAVFSAEAFHWFDHDVAVAEIARVLRSGGALVLLWNRPAGPTEPSTGEAERILRARLPEKRFDYDPLDLSAAAAEPDRWSHAFDGAPFSPLRHVELPNEQALAADDLVAFYASMGWVGDLPDDERLPLLAEVRAHLSAELYVRRWTTSAWWARRL